MENREFIIEELKEYDGRDGRPAYVACRGKVYDVSESISWEEGDHQALHAAGQDLTAEIEEAPHDEDMLDDFPQVGTLRGE